MRRKREKNLSSSRKSYTLAATRRDTLCQLPSGRLLRRDGVRAACATTAWRYLIGLTNIPRGPRGLPIAYV
eukprot:scaffold3299_cov116-Isochrysis_galbana.AAC.2